MKTLPLGRTGITVSDWCLGTMTWPTHTPEPEAHAQIERAAEAGINFMDTAEMYPVNPVRAETVGQTEACIGNWFAKTGRRDEWVVATKVSGPNGFGIRGGVGYTPDTIAEAVEASLRRLQTEYIDLYQLHWPVRGSYQFRQNWTYDPSGQDRERTLDHMAGILEAMEAQVRAGKVRAFGLSNESAWGTAQWLRLAEQGGAPRVASVQNEYSLLCRLWDTDMAELSVNEDVVLLAFSPLAAGLLTGKYQGGAVPEGSRMSFGPELGGRRTERAFAAVEAYHAIAGRHGIDPIHMALAWLRTRPFPVVNLFGATRLEQLDHILAGDDVTLSPEVLDEIDTAHRAHPMPY